MRSNIFNYELRWDCLPLTKEDRFYIFTFIAYAKKLFNFEIKDVHKYKSTSSLVHYYLCIRIFPNKESHDKDIYNKLYQGIVKNKINIYMSD